MSEKLIRTYKKHDPKVIKSNLLTYGDLAGACENCSQMDIKLDVEKCPACSTEFQYVAFRNIKNHFPKVIKLMSERPNIVIVDYDDYKRMLGASKAEDLLK